jgi:hypothetical protein
MTYLKFAYLAEFAVAFNLAFGEFKQEKIAEKLDDKITNLDQKFDAPLNAIAKKALSEVDAHKSVYIDPPKASWYSLSIIRFDAFRNYRKKTTNEYKPLSNFVQRIVLFASDPKNLTGKRLLDKRVVLPLRVWLSVPKGLLASWTYTKTKNWTYPPCPSSLIVWVAIVSLSMFILFEPEYVHALSAFYSLDSVDSLLSSHSFIFFLGLCCSIFTLRPISYFGARFIGRTPTPRARYYQMAMVFVTSLVIILLTWCEIVDLPSQSVFEEISYFLLGLLIYAISLPLLLLMGHLILETTVSNWTDWAESAAQEAAQAAISDLTQSK